MGSFKYPKKDEVIVEFSITDSGIGISKENFDKVFESFSQEGTYINRRFGGTGLGLAITKRFVEIQKGKTSGGDINVSLLSKGIYFFEFNNGEKTTVKTFAKN